MEVSAESTFFSSSKLYPAFMARKPETIKYSDALPADKPVDKPEYQRIPLEQLTDKDSFEYVDGIVANEADIKLVWNNESYPKAYPTNLENMLFDNDVTDKFMLCKMEHDLGLGLFLAPDAQTIKAGTPVILYGGILSRNISPLDLANTDYGIAIDPSIESEKQSIYYSHSTAPEFDALQYGNLARYVQHAPDDIDHQKMLDRDEIKKYVATANCTQLIAIYNGFPVIYFQALRDIKPNELITITYGLHYFPFRGPRGMSEYLLNTQGQVIGVCENNEIRKHTSFKPQKAVVNGSRVDMTKAREYIYNPFKAEPNVNFRTRFIKNIHHTLQIAIQMYAANSDIKTHLQDMLKALESVQTAEQKYRACTKIYNQKKFPEQSRPVKKELAHHILEFHAAYKEEKDMQKNVDSSKMIKG